MPYSWVQNNWFNKLLFKAPVTTFWGCITCQSTSLQKLEQVGNLCCQLDKAGACTLSQVTVPVPCHPADSSSGTVNAPTYLSRQQDSHRESFTWLRIDLEAAFIPDWSDWGSGGVEWIRQFGTRCATQVCYKQTNTTEKMNKFSRWPSCKTLKLKKKKK